MLDSATSHAMGLLASPSVQIRASVRPIPAHIWETPPFEFAVLPAPVVDRVGPRPEVVQESEIREIQRERIGSAQDTSKAERERLRKRVADKEAKERVFQSKLIKVIEQVGRGVGCALRALLWEVDQGIAHGRPKIRESFEVRCRGKPKSRAA